MSLPVLSANAVPGVSSAPLRLCNASKNCTILAMARRSDRYPRISSSMGVQRTTMTRLNAAGFAEVEPDIEEDPIDRWATPSIDSEDFLYGIYDGHHTYYEGEEKGLLILSFFARIGFFLFITGSYVCIFAAGGVIHNIPALCCLLAETSGKYSRKKSHPPNHPLAFKVAMAGVISWLFLPTVALAMYLDVPGEYLYIGAAVYAAVFCIIEMNKPDQPHNFEPQIYNMERGARDKLIADYNSMDIWDFNEKYGDLWDFTVKKDDITRR